MRRIAFACILLCVSLFGTAAEARRGIGVVNYGDEIFDLGPALPSRPETHVGRLCQHLGLFWADIATWNCRLVFTNADLTRYGELPAGIKAVIEVQYADAKPDRGIWNQYGAFVMLGVVGLALLFKLAKSHAGSGAAPQISDADIPIPTSPSSPGPARMAAGGARASFGQRGTR